MLGTTSRRLIAPSAPAHAPRHAHVGWTGSTTDKVRLNAIQRWLDDHRPREYRPAAIADVKFDLAYIGGPSKLYGGDFLLDRRRFDTVVLHYLFVGWTATESLNKPPIADLPFFGCSPKQSASAWRRRLCASGARRIFVFGGSCEVSGSYLLELPGYRKIHALFGTVYERR